MYFTFYIPAGIGALILVVVLVGVSHLGLSVYNRWQRRQTLHHSNEAPGILFGALTLIYSLLFAFIFAAVWDNYEDLNRTIEQEADDLNSVLIHSAALPDSLQVPIGLAIKSYCEKVVSEEWNMDQDGDHVQGSAIPALRLLLFQVQPENRTQETVLALIDTNLNSITDLHRERLSHTRSHVPQLVWMMLLVSTALVIVFSYFLQVETPALKRILLSFFWAMTGISLFLVYMLDHPFEGSTQVSKAAYEDIIKLLTVREAN